MTDVLDARPERRLSAAGGPAPVEDETIESLAEEIEEDEERGEEDEERGSDAAPFDLGIPEPRAIDLRKIWKLAGQKPDAQILAALGPNVPVLLSHSITAFPVGAGKLPRVWGIRYGSQLFGIDARTVSVQPTTELLNVLTVGAEAELAVGLAGELSVPDAVGAAIETVPGVALNDARVAASLNESAKLRIRFTLSVPKVIAGTEARGGARWQLYAQDRRLDGHQAMLQTLLVPKGTKRIRTEIVASVAAAGWFGPREWRFETETFDLALDGL
jgi:hypothetical protein